MEVDLVRHPSSPAGAIEGIHVSAVRRPDDRIILRYRLAGDLAAIAMPVLMATERADELWKTTCFEAFLRRPNGKRYMEFNFSPSTRWQVYIFENYREGRRDFEFATVPRFDMAASTDSFELGVTIDVSNYFTEEDWRPLDLEVGLSAVIETRDREKSYWALAHPPGDAPDFHHGDCFTGVLRAPAAE